MAARPKDDRKKKGPLFPNDRFVMKRSPEDVSKKDAKLYEKEVKLRENMKKKHLIREGTMRGIRVQISTSTGAAPTNSIPQKSGAVSSASSKKQTKLQEFCITKLEDLPEDVQESIERMNIPEKDLLDNFEVLLKVLSFGDRLRPKRRFYTKAEWDLRQDPTYDEKKEKNTHGPMPDPEGGLYEHISLRDARKMYKWTEFMGEGGFGSVVTSKVLKKDLHPKIKRLAIKIQRYDTKKRKELIDHEVRVMKRLDHENMCIPYRFMMIEDECWIAMELLEGGTLKKAASSEGVFQEKDIAYVARETLKGIAYMHRNNLIHRDLKNQNIMLTVKGGVKLIDFGLTLDASQGPTIQMCGSPFWMPPEMIRGEPHHFAADVWSFAICMLELANKRPPNASNIKRAMFLTATRILPDFGLRHPMNWSDKFKSFLECCVQTDPSKRSSPKELLEHPFLQCSCGNDEMIKLLTRVFVGQSIAMSGF
mmetsp:Transcript_5576/g.14100  ORF Transcript_5576/g.14100 Transcript_5576/m.14100 type:complete len:478 (-) Transcript_5576:135-1568(-)|eukprot:CAMPEP_0177649472 /NCGR_PEP_ID=MMETSP0447-20121125/11411_1 /TAXON_ID=0 /ORGANISM="Stygamoeba regulata, Strain BSH-02190019" /LENGTH=477 /DNA_ID=CAMNT_0019152245 /DNA_START=164 /DNA_END=1597 /DNA_ORIENTATION=-